VTGKNYKVDPANAKLYSNRETASTCSVEASVDLIMDFTEPIIRGVSLFHCDLLSHEDKGIIATISQRALQVARAFLHHLTFGVVHGSHHSVCLRRN
jgi:hypothetical protein